MSKNDNRDPLLRDAHGFQMWQVDRDSLGGRRLLLAAKRAAVAEWKNNDPANARLQLKKIITSLGPDALAPLCFMWMLVHPTTHAGATGAGGIWAMASRIVNEVAKEISRDLPTFYVPDSGTIPWPT